MKIEMKKTVIKNNTIYSGFAMLEIMLSFFLITVGIIASLALIGGGIKQSAEAKNQSIANGLAQEGVELVRNIRDNNWASGVASFAKITPNSNVCRVDKDYAYPADMLCNNSSLKVLKIDANGVYQHSAGTDTKFKRKIITSTGAPLIITSLVWWGSVDFSAATDTANCTAMNSCVYASVSLSRWGSSVD